MFTAILSAGARIRVLLPLLVVLVLAACSGSGDESTAESAAASGECASSDGSAPAEMSANQLEFSTDCIEATAGSAFTISFTNEEAAPHNIAIYTDDSKSEILFEGEIVSGPDGTAEYEVPALDAGEYYFDCQVHPEMNGTVTIS
jgi:plastocyanin